MTDHATHYERLGAPHLRGQATEAVVKAAFLLRGVPVLVPEYDNEPYDLVVEYDERFLRLQVKTGYDTDDGTVTFETVSTRARSDGYERSDYRGNVDYFSVYSPSQELVYLVDVDTAARGKMQLRYEPPANNQQAGINWHTDYELDTVLKTLDDG